MRTCQQSSHHGIKNKLTKEFITIYSWIDEWLSLPHSIYRSIKKVGLCPYLKEHGSSQIF